jgi:hypothetical protein
MHHTKISFATVVLWICTNTASSSYVRPRPFCHHPRFLDVAIIDLCQVSKCGRHLLRHRPRGLAFLEKSAQDKALQVGREAWSGQRQSHLILVGLLVQRGNP